MGVHLVSSHIIYICLKIRARARARVCVKERERERERIISVAREVMKYSSFILTSIYRVAYLTWSCDQHRKSFAMFLDGWFVR